MGSLRVLALLAAAGAIALGQTKEIHRTLPLPADGRVELDTYKGSIRVIGWDRAEVQVDLRIQEDWGPFAAPVSFADARIEARAGAVEIESKFDRWKTPFGIGGSQPLFHYTIQMPRTARLKIDDYKSESDISGLAGDVDLKTYKGRVRASGLEGGFRVDTHKGEVRAGFTRFTGRTSAETHKGRIELEIPRGSAFDLRTEFDKKVRFDSDFLASRRRGANSGLERINGGGPELRLESHKGTVRVLER